MNGYVNIKFTSIHIRLISILYNITHPFSYLEEIRGFFLKTIMAGG